MNGALKQSGLAGRIAKRRHRMPVRHVGMDFGLGRVIAFIQPGCFAVVLAGTRMDLRHFSMVLLRR